MTATAEKKDSNIITMKNVIFMYTSVTRPIEQLNTDNKPPLSDSPLEFHSFEVKVLITEARYKQLKKAYKGAKNLPNAKEFDGEEIKTKFDLDLTEFGLDSDEDMVLIKFSQPCLVGKEGARKESFPIKQIGIKGKVQDMDGNAVGQGTNLANGTQGHFQFRPVEGRNGLYLYPQLLCITHLIEYVGGAGEEDYESLGIEDLDEANLDEAAADNTAEQEAAQKGEASPAEKETKEDALVDPMF